MRGIRSMRESRKRDRGRRRVQNRRHEHDNHGDCSQWKIFRALLISAAQIGVYIRAIVHAADYHEHARALAQRSGNNYMDKVFFLI